MGAAPVERAAIKDELCNRNDTRRHEAETRLKLLWPLIMLNSRILGFIWRGKAYFVNIDTNGTTSLIYQEKGNDTRRRRVQNKYPNMVKLEQNPGYSARPPVVIWRSRPVAKSAYYPAGSDRSAGCQTKVATFGAKLKTWTHKMFHIFHFLQALRSHVTVKRFEKFSLNFWFRCL